MATPSTSSANHVPDTQTPASVDIAVHRGSEFLVTHQGFAPSTHQWHAEVQAFRDHIDHRLGEHAHTGLNGGGETEAFVCREALVKYWKQLGRVKAVLDRDENNEAHLDVILSTHLETFSILCYVSCSGYINQFIALQIKDSILPIDENHYQDSGNAGFRDALAQFCAAQWEFNPLVFDNAIHEKQLSPQCILPVLLDKTPLAKWNSDESVVYKASVYPCCVRQLGPKLKSAADTYEVALKMLSSGERELWANEVSSYNSLARNSPDHFSLHVGTALTPIAPSAKVASAFDFVTRCLGSFVRTSKPNASHGLRSIDLSATGSPHRAKGEAFDQVAQDLMDKPYAIMLEYARGGNLSTFCQRHANFVTSRDRKDRLNLWHQMFHLLQGLSFIHSIDGTHQDIKESNILCMSEDYASLSDRHTACFKLSDLGKSHFKRKPGDKDVNNVGNRTYMAPECCGAETIEQILPRPYTKAADIWSLGCLFSDMLVRSSLGQEGVNRYRDARIAENKNRNTLVADYGPQSFHDGIGRLSCVKTFHDEALAKSPEDEVLLAVSNIILEHMLQPVENRKHDGLTIRGHWQNHIGARSCTSAPASGNSLIPTIPPGPPPPPPAPPTPRSPPPPPPPDFLMSTALPPRPTAPASIMSAMSRRTPISIGQLAEHLRQPQKLRLTLRRSGVKLEDAFPDLAFALSVVKVRNHHFVVDGSETMAQHQDQAAEAVWVLSKILKSTVSRQDHVKLSIFAETIKEQEYRLRTCKEFRNIVRSFPFGGFTSSLLGYWLQRTATEIINGLIEGKTSPPISFYILTDGKFEDVPPDFARPINSLVQELRARQSIMPSGFSMTIIRFGDDPEALNQLLQLQQSVSDLPELPPQFNPIRIYSSEGDVADMLCGKIRDSTVNVSMTTRRDTAGIPNG